MITELIFEKLDVLIHRLDDGEKVSKGEISSILDLAYSVLFELMEKQKIKAYYGILERQFARYFELAKKSSEMTGVALLKTLECRLDNLVYRTGFARSIRQARQMVSHGHILVNGAKVDIPSYGVKVNDVISLKEKSRTNVLFQDNFEGLVAFNVPYLEKDKNQFSAKLIREPLREELPIDVNEILAVELYSK